MISHAEALALVHAHVATLSSESVASADAEGRVLAEVLSSPAELPPFDNSAMDGFALATAGTGALADSEHVVSGTVAAGQDVGAAATGTAWEIMTGAGVPTSADAVVPIEQVQILERDGERPSRIRLRQPVRAGQHIRRRGEDVCLHDRVIEAGTVLRGAHLMLLAGLGCARVQVMRRPRVADCHGTRVDRRPRASVAAWPDPRRHQQLSAQSAACRRCRCCVAWTGGR